MDLRPQYNKLNHLGSHERYVTALVTLERALVDYKETLNRMADKRLATLLAWATHQDVLRDAGRRLKDPVFKNFSVSVVDWDYSLHGEWALMPYEGDDMTEALWGALAHCTGAVVPLTPPLPATSLTPPLPATYALKNNSMLHAILRDTKVRRNKVDVKDILDESNPVLFQGIVPRLNFDKVGAQPARHCLLPALPAPEYALPIEDGYVGGQPAASSGDGPAAAGGEGDIFIDGYGPVQEEDDDEAPAGYGGNSF